METPNRDAEEDDCLGGDKAEHLAVESHAIVEHGLGGMTELSASDALRLATTYYLAKNLLEARDSFNHPCCDYS